MKAIVCRAYGPPETLVYAEVPDPVIAPGKVLIRVAACSVNFPDTLIIEGRYQFRPEPPFSPGSDVSGVIEAVGEGVTRFAVGDAVIAVTVYGGFAERVLADEGMCIPKPPGIDDVHAAAFLLTYGTSYHALVHRAGLQAGETVLVLGAAGGVGLAAVELAKRLGARVIAAASTEEKRALCRAYGADETIDYGTEDLRARLKILTDGRGVDVVYDPVGGAYAEPALRSMAWGGRYLVVGFAAGEIPSIPLNLPLLKGCAIVGVFFGAFARNEPRVFAGMVRELMGWLSADELRPHIQATYPLREAPRALEAIAARAVLGKVVVTVA